MKPEELRYGVEYLNSLMDEQEQDPTPERAQRISEVMNALDPEGAHRKRLQTEDQRGAEAEQMSTIDRVKVGGQETADRFKTATGQLFADSDAERQRAYQDYAGRRQERRAALSTPAGQLSEFGTAMLPGTAAAIAGAALPQVSIPAAIGLGAAGGAAEMVMTNPSQGENFVTDKLTDAGIGATIGGAVPASVGAGRYAARKAGNALIPRPPVATPDPGVSATRKLLLEGQQGGAEDMLRLAGPRAATPSGLAADLGIPLTPARKHFMNTGDRGLLAVEEAAKRRHGSEVGARVGADRRATQEGLESAFNDPNKIPGTAGFSPGEARAFGGRLLDHAEHLKKQERAAWDVVDQRFVDDPALDPGDTSSLFIRLKEVLKNAQIPDDLDGIGPLFNLINKNIGTTDGMTIGGLSNLRKTINQYMGNLAPDKATTMRAHQLVKQDLDKAIMELQRADHNGSALGLQAMKDAIRTSAKSAQFTRGKFQHKLSRTRQKTEIAKFIENMEHGKSADGAVKSMLRGDSSAKTRNVLKEIREQMGEDAYQTARTDMRNAFFKEMKRGKFDEGGALYTEEGYRSSATQMSKFIQDNKETFEALFDAPEQQKIKTAIALQKDLATPQDTANWSNTASAGVMLNTLSRLPVVSKYAQPVKGFVEEGAMERNMSRLLYPDQ